MNTNSPAAIIDVVTIIFDLPLADFEPQGFRGAVLKLLGDDVPVVFHNHKHDGYSYSYPLVQYKVINGNASVVLLGDGTGAMEQLLSLAGSTISVSGKTHKLKIESFSISHIDLKVSDSMIMRQVKDWCPLSGDNFSEYKTSHDDNARKALLEKILVGNILSMCKGLGIYIEDTIICTIDSISNKKSTPYKGVDYITMDVKFKTNIPIPFDAGLGKHSSVGFGTIAGISD